MIHIYGIDWHGWLFANSFLPFATFRVVSWLVLMSCSQCEGCELIQSSSDVPEMTWAISLLKLGQISFGKNRFQTTNKSFNKSGHQ